MAESQRQFAEADREIEAGKRPPAEEHELFLPLFEVKKGEV
jgi:hypothetical protein